MAQKLLFLLHFYGKDFYTLWLSYYCYGLVSGRKYLLKTLCRERLCLQTERPTTRFFPVEGELLRFICTYFLCRHLRPLADKRNSHGPFSAGAPALESFCGLLFATGIDASILDIGILGPQRPKQVHLP